MVLISNTSIGALTRTANTQFWKGNINEVNIAYPALSTPDRNAIEAGMKSYYSTP